MDTEVAEFAAQEFRRLGADIEQHRAGMVACSAKRRRIVRRLNESGMGYGSIAALLGVSKGHVQQMANDPRETKEDTMPKPGGSDFDKEADRKAEERIQDATRAKYKADMAKKDAEKGDGKGKGK